MLDDITRVRKYIPLLLILALIATVFYQITSAQSVRSVDLDSTILVTSILLVAIIAFVTLRNLYNFLLELGLTLIIYTMTVRLVEEFLTEFTLVQTLHLSVVFIAGLTLTLLGVRITIKKRQQDIEQYKVQEAELKDRYTELAEMAACLDQANKKNRLLTSLTRHDLLNQITIIQSFNAVAIEEIVKSDPEKIQKYLSHVMLAGKQIEKMIRFTKEYEEIGISAIGWQQVNRIITSSDEEFALDAFIMDNAIPDNLEIYADPIIRKVFMALLEQSICHGQKSTIHIRLSCSKSDDRLLIIYEDDGAGIPPERKELIFDSVYGKHAGPGLFLAREILSITGLSIRECGVQGEGARFEISVPEGKFRGSG
ncbi:MAG TPA: HAMP domain-containing sensor histidine kinase [Methanospirillum sp.]|nr:HAMP domain-containing sensor histidine kinase [Methanospirillum sp.]